MKISKVRSLLLLEVVVFLFMWTANSTIIAAPPVDFYQIDNGGSAFINTNADTDSDSISGAPPGGICTLRDALDIFNTGTTTLGAQGNGCTLSNPSGTLPVPPVYVINLPAYTYSLVNPPPFSNDALRINNVNDDALFLVGMTSATTIIEAAVSPPSGTTPSDNRVFDVFDGTVEFSNMTIRHGFCQNICSSDPRYGGGIWNNRNLMTLDNVIVTDNFADERGGGIYNVAGGTLNIVNGSVITNNTMGRPGFSSGDGGGIYSIGNSFFASNVTIDDSIVSNNINLGDVGGSGGGGGIYNTGDSMLTVQNGSLIDGNNSGSNSSGGGGIYNRQGTVLIDNSTISNNIAVQTSASSGGGGGIYNTSGGVVDIINNSIIGGIGNGNIADNGSGIFNDDFLNSQVTIDNSTVSFNGIDALVRSRFGGGIYNQSTLTIRNASSIINNAVEQFDGGGILNEGVAGVMTITDSVIDNNSAGSFSFVGGGGIYNRSSGTLDITNSTVNNNTSRNGGGIVNSGSGSVVTIDSTIVSGNSATIGSAGGIYNRLGGIVNIQNNSTVGGATPNTAAGSGGGIFNVDPDSLVTINNSTVDNNTANFSGGGIFNQDGAEVEIFDSSVNNNTATTVSGGGIFNDGVDAVVTINNSSINGNRALGGTGGGIHNEDNGTVIIENASTVSSNTAAGNGGGINNISGFAPTRPATTTLTITDSTLEDNSAGANGGAISNDAPFDTTANVTITNSVIGSVAQPNTAVEGGAIFNDSASFSGFGNITIEAGSIIKGNTASGANGGGAISNFADFDGTATVEINNSIVMSNQATSGRGGAILNFATSGAISDIIINNDSTIQSNSAAQEGGAIFNDANFEFGDDGISTITIDTTLIGANIAGTDGGAIYNTRTNSQATSTINVTNSRLLVNSATNGGGIFHNDGTTSIIDSCIVDNGEGYRNTTSITQTAQRNWWGTFDGPSDADGLSGATGSGDGVTQFVDFSNFEIAPILGCPLSNIPYYSSVPVPGSTIILSTRPNRVISGTIVVTNLGGAQLDLTNIGFGGGLSELILLTSTPVNIASATFSIIGFECLSSSTGIFIDTLTVDHNAIGTPATYTIECRVRENATETVEVIEPESDDVSIEVFDPAISKIGVLQPGQVGLVGEEIEWKITVTNNGNAVGNNIVIVDNIILALQIDGVSSNVNSTINGQTVTVTLETLAAGQSVTYSIFTTVLESSIIVDNMACMSSGIGGDICTIAQVNTGLASVTELPSTGETPNWRNPLLLVLALSSLLILIGTGAILRRQIH